MSNDPKDKVNAEAEHTKRISSLFATIAGRYDFLNRLHSFRQDVAWRRKSASKMRFFKTMRYLDVATGTADLALEVVRQNKDVKATGVDLVEELMEIGRQKVSEAALDDRVELKVGNALDLEFADESFDVAGIAFGIRNIKDRVHALSEMRRTVVPGGQVLVLELCFSANPLLSGIYHLYLNRIMPTLAKLLSRNPEAYKYLAESIMNFPRPKEFCSVMESAGLVDVQHYPLTFGVARLFVGQRPQ